MIIADENVDARIIVALRTMGLEVYSIAEKNSGYSDEEVIDIAKEKSALIITRDKDFGEWVFAHHVSNISVILLRYKQSDINSITNSLLQFIRSNQPILNNTFTTITTTKTRMRNIP